MSLSKSSPITTIKGIGDKQSQYFAKLNIDTIEDLLFHIPFRYQDTSSLISIEEFKENGTGTFLASIEDVKTTYFRKRITTVKVKDETGTLRLIYFNQPYLQKTFQKDDLYIFNAKITVKGKSKNIYNPKYELFKYNPENQSQLGKMVGIYPETSGLSSKTIRSKVKMVTEDISKIISEPLSENLLKQSEVITLPKAITQIHFPETNDDIETGKARLAFDEMLRIGIKIEKQKLERLKEKAHPEKINTKELNLFIKTLPYKLTKDQNKAIEEILDDMTKTIPMNRLLNGDVGSGKTIVAALAILNSIMNKHSAILLAPTTVLAQQHFDSFKKLFANFNIKIELSLASKKISSKKNNKLIIGTHALLFEENLPSDLNLVIIDEQHRFGVQQREYFKRYGKYSPHHLTMTATPIPRSLTEIFFGGLDVSEIREKPINRKDIKTYYTPTNKRIQCFEWIERRIRESEYQEQAFIIYPLIEETEKSASKAVMNEYENLKKLLPNTKIAFLHGKLKEKEKTLLLDNFRKKNIHILISTTVIEVGIDIPDATIMVIEDAERFGLAQLHQLRGRVGRSYKESFCFVIPSSTEISEVEERLKYFASHNSGFEVAEYDLQRRGPGEVYGLKQSGVPNFKVANIHDTNLLKKARVIAKYLLKDDNQCQYVLENLFK